MSSLTDSASNVVQPRLDELETPPLSLGQLAWRRFRRHKMAIFGTVVIILIFLYCFGGMRWSLVKPMRILMTRVLAAASLDQTPFGTDTIGRYQRSRTHLRWQIPWISA
jgi:hypothetical protein